MRIPEGSQDTTVILKITMRNLEVLYSMYPTIKLDEKEYPTDSFFDKKSGTEVAPGANCTRDPNMNQVSMISKLALISLMYGKILCRRSLSLATTSYAWRKEHLISNIG